MNENNAHCSKYICFLISGYRDSISKAFSMVELLVVISIIIILISLLMPSLKLAGDKAKSMKCQSNLKQMGTAWNMYATDYNSYIPTALQKSSASGSGGSSVTWYCRDALGQYVNYYGIHTDSAVNKKWQNTVFNCPSNKNGALAPASGSATINYGYNNLTQGLGSDNSITLPYLMLQSVAPDTFVIADTAPVGANVWGSLTLGFGSWASYGLWGYSLIHKNGANYLAADGHVSFYPITKLFFLASHPVEPKATRFKD